MRRDLVLPWIACAVLWIGLMILHDSLQVWNSIGLNGEETSQFGNWKFWTGIVAFPPAAVLACLIVIDRVFMRSNSGR